MMRFPWNCFLGRWSAEDDLASSPLSLWPFVTRLQHAAELAAGSALTCDMVNSVEAGFNLLLGECHCENTTREIDPPFMLLRGGDLCDGI